MSQFWLPLTDTSTDVINSVDGVTTNQSVAAFLSANPGSYVEYDNLPTEYPNLIFNSSESSAFGCVVNSINVTADLLGGAHSPHRPK